MAHDQDDETPASPFSSTGFQLSALFLLVLVVAGIAIAIFHGGNGTAKGSRKHVIVTANSPSGTSTANTTRGPCSLPAGSQQVPSGSPPAGVTWNAVGSMSAPQSAALGPQRVENGINVCFAHNPSGALVAAMNLIAEGTTAISERQVFDALSINVPSAVTTEPAIDDSGSGVQIVGYKYDSYSSENAAVDVVVRGPQGGLRADQMTMLWTGDDWKYVFPPSGPVYSDLDGAQVEAPYVSWSGF